ncbi:hypothetical protein B0H63DRAFT_543632 [Podospora didyma]|uniref:DUF6604 domain-containing protein n=1 Tax=Podospora didyma TaxID=330526 RepID=A0AAE0NPI9_9PEZI|nr:hypothetical protein B0H63DRAFT_543632 [Podospora didyma]
MDSSDASASGLKGGMGTWQRYKLGPIHGLKVSRKAKKRVAKDIPEAEPEPQLVALKALESMAQTIAPFNILRDVVGLHKRSSRFFQAAASRSADKDLRKSNTTHLHMIKILDSILGKFEVLRSKEDTTSQDAKPGSGVSVDDLKNMFQHLRGEIEVDNQSETSTSGGKKSTTPKAKKKPVTKPKNRTGTNGIDSWINDFSFLSTASMDALDDADPFDPYMLICCLFEDFNLIKDYVVERWCDYYYEDRPTRVDTLVVLTNAAFEMFHKPEQDLNTMMLMDPQNPSGIPIWHKHEIKMGEEADRLGMTANSIPGPTLKFSPKGATSMAPHADGPKPDDTYGAATRYEKFKLQVEIVQDILQDLNVIRALKRDGPEGFLLPAESEFMLDFEDALRRVYDSDTERSIASIFSLQLWLDIRTTFETKVEDAFVQMQAKANHVRRMLVHNLDLATGPRKHSQRGMERKIREIDRFMIKDITYHENNFIGIIWGTTMKLKISSRTTSSNESRFGRGCLSTHGRWPLMETWLATAYTNEGVFRRGLQILDPKEIMHNFAAFAPLLGTYTHITPDQGDECSKEIMEDAKSSDGSKKLTNRPSKTKVDHQILEACKRKEFAGRIGIRESLYSRYAYNRRDCYYFLQYLEEPTVHRLKIALSKTFTTNRSLLPTPTSGVLRNKKGKIPESWSREDDEPDLFYLAAGLGALDEAAERTLKQGAMLAQLPPVHILKLLDENLTTQLGDVLELDYLTLRREATELVYRVWVDTEDRRTPEEGGEFILEMDIEKFDPDTDEPDMLAKLLSFLAKAMDEDEEGEVYCEGEWVHMKKVVYDSSSDGKAEAECPGMFRRPLT